MVYLMYLYAKIIHEQSQNTSLNISLEQWVFQNMLVVVIDVGYAGNLFYLMYKCIVKLMILWSLFQRYFANLTCTLT